jgi:hypothetical protein
MGYTYKRVCTVPIGRNTEENIEKRFRYCMMYKKMLADNHMIVFLGQSNFNSQSEKKKYGWSFKGQPINVTAPVVRQGKVSLLALLGTDGVMEY